MIYRLHRLGNAILPRCPLWISYGLAKILAPAVYYVWGSKRRATLDNLRRVLGPGASARELRRLGRNIFRNYGRYLIDMVRLPHMDFRQVENGLVVLGWEHVDRAMKLGKGLILVGGHLGNSDLAGAILARRGYPVNVIVDTLHPPEWNEMVQGARVLSGMKVIPLESSARKALGVVRRNEVLAFLVDRPLESGGVNIKFFGQDTMVPAGAAKLALKTGAALLAACVVWSGKHLVAHISPQQSIEPCGDLRCDVQRLTQKLMDTMEVFIKRYPDQWYMFRPMWPANCEGIRRSF